MSRRHDTERIPNITERPPVYSRSTRMTNLYGGMEGHKKYIGFEHVVEEMEKTVRNARRNAKDVSPQKTTSLSDDEDSETSIDHFIEEQKPQSNSQEGWWPLSITACIFVMIVVFATLFFNTDVKNNRDIDENKYDKLKKGIKQIQAKFPSQNEDMWYKFSSGIKTIETEEPVKPSVFLLLHNDEKTSACLARRVGTEAVKFLSETVQVPIIIKGEDMKKNISMNQDYGLFAETHKSDIKEKHVMVVLDLHKIPAKLAQTFHSLCDSENPVVRKAAYLFTMHSNEHSGSPTTVAEKTLKRLWQNSLDIDKMEPLITRITDTVFFLNPEYGLEC